MSSRPAGFTRHNDFCRFLVRRWGLRQPHLEDTPLLDRAREQGATAPQFTFVVVLPAAARRLHSVPGGYPVPLLPEPTHSMSREAQCSRLITF